MLPENWGNETCDRSIYSEQLPFGSPFQNGDQQIYQSLHSSRYIDHQTGPFGLPVAPHVFTRVFQTVMAHLHTLYLGFLISWKKSQILPSQDFFVLGEHYRTDLGLIFPPEEQFQSFCQKILIFSNSPSVTARQFSQLLSFLNSLADVVPLGRLHIRRLQLFLQEHWDSASQDWEALVPILPVLLPHLDWWTRREMF